MAVDPAEKWGDENAAGNADAGWDPTVHQGGGETSPPTGNLHPTAPKRASRRTPKTDDYRPPTNPPASTGPGLRGIDGGGESTPRDKSHLSESPTAYDQPGNADTDPYSADSVSPNNPKSKPGRHLRSVPAGDDLARQEEEAAEDTTKTTKTSTEEPDLGAIESGGGTQEREGFYRPKGTAQLKGRFTRKQKIAGGTVGAGIIATIIGLFAIFVPILRLEGYINSINDRVMAGVTNAVQKRSEKLMESYFLGYASALERCNNVISVHCQADYRGLGKATQMLNLWRDAHIEEYLFNKQHMEIRAVKNPQPGQQKFRILDPFGKELTLKNGQLIPGKFTGGSRELGQEMKKFSKIILPNLNQIIQRREVRKYGARKLGTTLWCLFTCKYGDKLDRKISDARVRLKYRMIERVIYPFSNKLGLIMECIVSGPSSLGDKCSPQGLDKQQIDRNLTQAEKDGLAKILKVFEEHPNLSFTSAAAKVYLEPALNRILERILERALGDVEFKLDLAKIPLVGQIYAALVLIDQFDDMKQFIKNYGLSHFAANLNALQYAEYYQVMRSSADEIKPGKLTSSEAGALADQYQGDQPAEQSRIYQAYNTNRSFSDISAGDQAYTCKNGKPIPSGQYVCPEKMIARPFKIEEIMNNPYVSGLDNLTNRYECLTFKVLGHCPPGLSPRAIIHPTLQIINTIASTLLGGLIGGFMQVLLHIPGIGGFLHTVQKALFNLMHLFLEWVFPLPIQANSLGRELYDGLEAGGEYVASFFAQGGYTDAGAYGMGGQRLSTSQQTAILQDYYQQASQDYQKSNLASKLTNLSYPGSLGNKLLANAPTNFGSFLHKFGAAVAKPFTSIFFTNHYAFAGGTQLPTSPFGTPINGYTVNDPAFQANPAKYTDAYCAKAKKEWEASQYIDKVTGFIEYKKTNPCLLEQVVTEAGASQVTQDDNLDDSLGAVPKATTTK